MDKEAVKLGRYINGEMSRDELIAFENALAEDPFLSEAVAGFRKDPGALLDLPVAGGVKIQWWWSLVGMFAVAAVFMLIPSKVIDVSGFQDIVKKEVFENLDLIVSDDAPLVERRITDTEFSPNTIVKNEDLEEEETILFVARTVYPKPARLVIKSEMPRLQLGEKIVFILDLKVVSNLPEVTEAPFYNLSDLTDFTPANFSTILAFKRSEKYKGIFAEPAELTYLERLEIGLKYFKKEDYTRAVRVFNLLLKENHQDVNATFYFALCEYELGNHESALLGFLKVEKMPNQTFNQESKWYRALCLLKMGRKDEALGLIMEIAEGDGHYAERAREF